MTGMTIAGTDPLDYKVGEVIAAMRSRGRMGAEVFERAGPKISDREPRPDPAGSARRA
jgi:hypothetical protein